MKNLSFLVLAAAALLFVTNVNAEPKAYQFAFDQALTEASCQQKLTDVATEYKLSAQPKDKDDNSYLNDSEGQPAGVAYYSNDTGICHIYVW